MTPTEIARASQIDLVGDYEGKMRFHTPSWTKSNEEGYEITVDKITGAVECTCMDFVGRRKQADVANLQFPGACKHIKLGLGPILRVILGVDKSVYERVREGLQDVA